MQPLRLGFTGSGFMGRTHVEAAHRLSETQPIAVTGGSRAAGLASDYGLACEPSLHQLLHRDDVDAIVIATPHWLHCQEALAAAAAGKHAFVEKPMATTLEDCRQMQETFRQQGLVLAIGYHQRFRESNHRTRELLAEGAIGAPRCLQMSALFDITTVRAGGFGGTWNWWTDPRSVAHLLNSGPHNIDLCRWWLGRELQTVAAAGGTFREDNPNENTTMALLQFDGVMATFWSSSVVPAPGFDGEAFRFRLMGDEGILDLDPYGRLQVSRGGQWETVYEQPAVGHEQADSAFSDNRMQAYCDQLRAFVGAVRGEAGDMKCGNPVDGRAGVAAVLAMLQSARTNQMIRLTAAEI